MAEFIDKEIVIQIIIDNFTCYFPNVTDAVRKIPAADVQPTARKPIKISDDEFWVQGYLVNEKYYCCPNCDKVLGNLRVHNVHELINEYKFCSECGQGLDWGNILTDDKFKEEMEDNEKE